MCIRDRWPAFDVCVTNVCRVCWRNRVECIQMNIVFSAHPAHWLQKKVTEKRWCYISLRYLKKFIGTGSGNKMVLAPIEYPDLLWFIISYSSQIVCIHFMNGYKVTWCMSHSLLFFIHVHANKNEHSKVGELSLKYSKTEKLFNTSSMKMFFQDRQ